MKLEIVSAKGKIFNGEVESALFPGLHGSFMVLPHHAPMVALLVEGEIQMNQNGERKCYPIQGGIVEVGDLRINVCID